MSQGRLLQRFTAAANRFGLSEIEVAALVGLSVPTIRLLKTGRVLPKHQRCIAALRDFVERSERAATRQELRLPARDADPGPQAA